MEFLQSVILGVVQGLTEFLPVSSSGHLVLLQNIFGLHEPELLFDISVHVGTLMAVCVVFRQDILSILKTLVRLPTLINSSNTLRGLYTKNTDIRFIVLIAIGNIPTAILGLFFHQKADQIFGSAAIVGIMLLITGTVLWITRFRKRPGRLIGEMNALDAICIGFIQGLAILPGISRSGATISIAIFLGLDRDLAGRYSFLMSVPAILGALMLNAAMSPFGNHIPMGFILSGAAAAIIVGYIALIILLKVVKQGRLYLFSPYCWLLGGATLLWYWI